MEKKRAKNGVFDCDYAKTPQKECKIIIIYNLHTAYNVPRDSPLNLWAFDYS